MKYLGKITDPKDLVTKEYVDTHSGGGGSKNIWYATCPTAASTTAKVVTTSSTDFTLTTGNMVRVLFTYANSASAPTLAVDGTTAKNVRVVSGTSGAQYHWQAGETVDFVYNGTYFLMVDRAPATTTYYGPTKLTDSTTSTSTTTAATPNSVKTVADLVANIGDFKSNSSNSAITTASINTYTVGPSITLNAGVWVIIGIWQFNSVSGARVTDVDLATDNSTSASTTTLLSRQRVANNNGSWVRLETTSINEFTSDTTVYVKGSATVTSAAQTVVIKAVRII